MKIYFGTTNQGKLREAAEILGINIVGTSLDIPEIQSLDPLEVASQKAKDYFESLKKPVFVEDVSLVFSALGKLPGPYISDFEKSLGNNGLISLLKNETDRSAIAQTTIAYIGVSGKVFVFTGLIKGFISSKPLGTNGFGWDPIFTPEGYSQTFAQMTNEEKNSVSMRKIALSKFKEWLDSQN